MEGHEKMTPFISEINKFGRVMSGPVLINSQCRVLLQSADVSEQYLLMENDYSS
jgi:hypothetical protein